jgi:cysteinyl-tRNA synthetase
VDDKINRAALDAGVDISELSERFTIAYNEDVKALGVLDATVEPRATHHIPEIIAMIERLIERGHAYTDNEGHVLFHVPSDPGYGSLSHRSLEDMIDGARVEVAHFKRDAKDFVLWKPSTPELPGWPSPWGRGRPGWHIECSAMIRKHLGATIDIHGGGNDLMFPHHENELAQGTSLGDGATYVRYWMHNGMLTLGNEKMSKSVGNIVTIRELLKRERGETLRYALLSGHYRSPLAWTSDLLAQARASLDRLYRALLDAPVGQITAPTQLANAAIANFPDGVAEALCDDLNTPVALAALHEIANEIYRSDDASTRRALRDRLLAAGWLLGLLDRDPAEHFRAGAMLDAAAIDALVAERTAARKRRDFARADAIRQQLDDNGIELEDGADGTRWKVRPPRT